MAATNNSQGKYKGEDYSGSSPADFDKLKQDSHYEFSGQYKAGENDKLTVEGGNAPSRGSSEESRNSTGNNFRGKGYESPGMDELAPVDKGVVSHADPSKA